MRHLALRFVIALASLPFIHAEKPPSKLKVIVTKPVECSRTTVVGDRIRVHYRGTLWGTATEFDNSFTSGHPFDFRLGQGEAIKGWDEGLRGMCVGEGRKLIIPPSMAYGDHDHGSIPAKSTLVFDTVLMSIEGVVELPTNGTLPSPPPHPPAQPAEQGECELLGDFSLLVQSALGLLALTSLVYKRWRETPRRPLKIWAFDASKQVVGSMMLHVLNVLMSMLSSGKFDIKDVATEAVTPGPGIVSRLMLRSEGFSQFDGDVDAPNPCSYYLLNIGIDTTIGIPILFLWLKVFHYAFSLTPLARPPISIKSGVYSPLPSRSDPNPKPRTTWWLKQCLVYFLALLGMKFCVLLIFLLCPWIVWVGDWALRWTEGSEFLQITFVMLVFPTVMNALQYWIIDSFIKEKKDPGVVPARLVDREESPRPGRGSEEGGVRMRLVEEDEDETNENVSLLKQVTPPVVRNRHGSSSDISSGERSD